MNISGILEELKYCTCGREHLVGDILVKIGPGLLAETVEILKNGGISNKLLVVADKNTLAAADGITDILEKGGYICKLKLYEDLRVADMLQVKELIGLSSDIEAILSVGSGSLNDICRLASFKASKPFAIFATAPSMDGFAANSAPITEDNFKKSFLCHAPKVIIGDTEILACAPQVLKSAGFSDMIAKYIALVDWKIAHLTVNEYFCPKIAGLTKAALDKTMALADEICSENTDAAAALMEGLVLSGLAMTLANATRPASGAEHIISHFWEIKKMEQGKMSDYHGRKVGVATLLTARLYHDIVRMKPNFGKDSTDWDLVFDAYGVNFAEEVKGYNNPAITDEISPDDLAGKWHKICEFVTEGLPAYEDLMDLMKRAGAAASLSEIQIEPALALDGLKYHPYMRRRINLTRLIPMLGVDVDYDKYITAL